MTNSRERWDDERLDKLADAVEAIRGRQEASQQQIEANRQDLQTVVQSITQLNDRTEIIATAVERLADVHLQTLQRIDEMQSEVRGLQTENRRILEELRRRNGGGLE